MQVDISSLRPLQDALDSHPVYSSLRGLPDLRVLMGHHVYAVWDFMSLVKHLQGLLAPAGAPWVPRGDASLRHFVNRLALEEECDQSGPARDTLGSHASHFELYCAAMAEVGADAEAPRRFVREVAARGLTAGLALDTVPEPARRFMSQTFAFIDSGRPHVVAAALALGREDIIPRMFRGFLARMGIGEREAPIFHYYLKRHIDLDGDLHGPLSLRTLEVLCAGDAGRVREAEQAAAQALRARVALWDSVEMAIHEARRAA